MMPKLRESCSFATKKAVVCPCCFGRARITSTIRQTTEDCSMCKGLRIVYQVTTYEAIPEEDVEKPLNVYPRGL